MKKTTNKKHQGIQILLGIMLIVATFFFLMRYQIFQIEGHSMVPTLQSKQYVLVQKEELPKRYDLVAFTKGEEYLVKRVIGMPGDRLIQSGDRLLLSAGGQTFDVAYSILLTDEGRRALDVEEVIPEGMYFMVGDAVDQSLDSRFFGLVSQEEIIGILP